jgi:thiamine-phosphate pyrophosphorylase
MTRSEINAFFDTLPPNAIYGLCDRALLDAFDLSLEQYAAHCRRESVSLIQYRNKHDDPERAASELKTLRNCWDGVLIVNDRWQLHTHCDGVHIGQDDLAAFGPDALTAAAQLRREVGDACILGLSTHNAAEIATANTLPIDYVGLGAFRATDTKSDAAVLGDALDALASASLHPVAAIGGVTYEDRFEHARMRVMGSAFFKGARAWK